ncbi:uncharacterized protein LOC127266011 [Andrographis paniculata]|uniref:uncharacterized protein LOC127266011 n=1 Tax=Andrographis paniculata TaxID=175694 RepID=UPI0021E880FB|nr:uncharacterized protein LOC127266011 [Andrographis paniculata]
MRGGGWMVAASIGAVESLKDQLGVCRWNYVLRSMQQNARSRLQSAYKYAQSVDGSDSDSAGNRSKDRLRMAGDNVEFERLKKTERSMKQVMALSCWGPTTVRF